MSDIVLEARNLQKVYNQQTVLNGLNFTIARGERVFLTGANGAGKTTLLEILIGLIPVTEGEIFFFGKNFKENKGIVLPGIFFLSHETFFYHSLTLWENLEFSLQIFQFSEKVKGKAREYLLKEKLEKVSLYFDRNKRFDQLSLGMRHRLSIARFLLWDDLNPTRAQEPKILFLDEPYSGLDKKATEMLDEILKEKFDSGFTLIEATHRLDYVEKVWNSVVKKNPPKGKGPKMHNTRILFLKNGKFFLDTDSENISKPLSNYWES